MHARLIPSRKSCSAVGSLVVVWLILSPADPVTPIPTPRSRLEIRSVRRIAEIYYTRAASAYKPERTNGRPHSTPGDGVTARSKLLSTRDTNPAEIRMYEVDGERILFPKHGYEQMYLQGWNECLYVIGNTNAGVQGDIRSSCLLLFKNDWASGAGLVAGFDDCQRRIISLAKIYNLDLIGTSPGSCIVKSQAVFRGSERSRACVLMVVRKVDDT